MFPVFRVDDAPPGARASRPHNDWHGLGHLRHSDRPGTAPGVSLGLAVEVHTDRVAACQVALTLSDHHKGIRMRAGRPRSRGDLLPLMGWGDGRVGAGDRYFFYEHRCTGCTGFFQERASLYSWESAIPPPHHRPGRLPVQQPLVLFILCILCIDVNNPFSRGACRRSSSVSLRGSASAADRHLRNAAVAPLRLDCGLRPCLADSPSRGE